MRRGCMLMLTIWMASVIGGCSAGANLSQGRLRLISTSDEIALGEHVAPEFERLLGGKVADEDVQRYVNRVGQKVAAVAGRRMPYEFHVLAPKVPNSFALPGGKIYITAGLLQRLRGERELAAVLANEIGHVCHRRPVKSLYRNMGPGVFVAMCRLAMSDPDEDGYLIARRVAREIILANATRKDEMKADSLAVKYLARAGYNPWAMPKLLATLRERYRCDETGRFARMRASHPMTVKRIKFAEMSVAVNYEYFNPKRPDPHVEDFAQVRDRLRPGGPVERKRQKRIEALASDSMP